MKRPELFLKAACEMPREKFTMICSRATGDDRYDELASRAGKIENLEFIQWTPFDRIDSFFARAKVFVNTSESEGFPHTYLHACKCATPILSLKVNPDDFLNRYNCGMCADDDWQHFTRLLGKLLEPETAASYGGNGRKYIEQEHDIAKIIEDYKKIFRQLMQGRN